MKDEFKSVEQSKFETLLSYHTTPKELDVHGSLRPNTTQLATSNVTKPNLLPKV